MRAWLLVIAAVVGIPAAGGSATPAFLGAGYGEYASDQAAPDPAGDFLCTFEAFALTLTPSIFSDYDLLLEPLEIEGEFLDDCPLFLGFAWFGLTGSPAAGFTASSGETDTYTGCTYEDDASIGPLGPATSVALTYRVSGCYDPSDWTGVETLQGVASFG